MEIQLSSKGVARRSGGANSLGYALAIKYSKLLYNIKKEKI